MEGMSRILIGKRIVSAALGILYLVLVIYLGGWYYNLSLICLMFVCLTEIYNAMEQAFFSPQRLIGYLFVLLLLPVFQLKGMMGVFALFTILSLASIALMIYKGKQKFRTVVSTIFCMVYPVIPLSFLLFIKYLQPYLLGTIALSTVLISAWTTDTFAYFTGITFGKHKICPQISPKKTIEGSIGGFLGSIIVSSILGFIFEYYLYSDIQWFHYSIMGFLAGVFAQIGDLSASAIKRYTGIKDFSGFFPGHGGMLDRFDSILFTAPVIYFYFVLIINK